MNNSIKSLRLLIQGANEAYRTGNAIITDEDYDGLKEELAEQCPEDPLLDVVGFLATDDKRKQKLPIAMKSMHKCKTLDEIIKWFKSRKIPAGTVLIATPKYDGLSLVVDEEVRSAYTRGNGEYGQRSDEHYNLLRGYNPTTLKGEITFGEAIMPRSVFPEAAELYFQENGKELSNPRNAMAGLFNDDKAKPILRKCCFVRYGYISAAPEEFPTKGSILDFLNEMAGYTSAPQVPYVLLKPEELTEASLKALFVKWNTDFELDGIILEVNDLQLQNSLGRERNGNPAYARAYKGNFEEVKQTIVRGVSWKTSKQGYLKPIVQVDSVNLDGVNVTNVTGNNARWIQEMGVGVGAVVKILRSGMVIPKVIKVLQTATPGLPTICTCGASLEWTAPNEADLAQGRTGAEIICSDELCESRQLMRNISFFRTLGVEDVSDGIITQFYDAGYQTVASILSMSQADMERVDRFGQRKAEKTYQNIHNKLQAGVPLPLLQHASGCFKNLGSKKLVLLEHFSQADELPTVGEIEAVEGFSTVSANAYLLGLPKYREFIKGLPIKVSETAKVEQIGSDLEGQQFVFTGVRLKPAEATIISRGGKIGSGVSKTTTYLVAADPTASSSKLDKARSQGVKVIGVAELTALLR